LLSFYALPTYSIVLIYFVLGEEFEQG